MGINDYLFLSIVIIFCILWIYNGFLKEYIQKDKNLNSVLLNMVGLSIILLILNVVDHFIYGQILIKKEKFIL